MPSSKWVRGTALTTARRVLIPAGVLTISFLMTSTGAIAAAPAGLIFSPPYHGWLAPNYTTNESGCGARATQAWKLQLSAGLTEGRARGIAGNCNSKGIPVGLTNTSAGVAGGFSIGLKLPRIPAGSTSLNVSLRGNFTISLTASDGGKSPTCNEHLTTVADNYTRWEWNWNGSVYLDSAVLVQYRYANGYTSNYSQYTAPVPTPFHLNATTNYLYHAYWHTEGTCIAQAFEQTYLYADLLNPNTGWAYPASSTDVPGSSSSGVQVYNTTDYSWNNSSYWNGPTHTRTGFNTTWVDNNTTLTSNVYVYTGCYVWYVCTNTYGTSSTQSWTNTTSLGGDYFTFNLSAKSSLRLDFELELVVDIWADNSWADGRAYFNCNATGTGNGIEIPSIAVT